MAVLNDFSGIWGTECILGRRTQPWDFSNLATQRKPWGVKLQAWGADQRLVLGQSLTIANRGRSLFSQSVQPQMPQYSVL